MTSAVSRRRMFQGAAGGAVLGAAAVGSAWWGDDDHHGASSEAELLRAEKFYDQAHPAGIATPPQRYAVFMTFDMTPGSAKADLQSVLAGWSAGIAQMMAGAPVGPIDPSGPSAIAGDTGEAFDLAPAGLTVTVGLGPGIFDDRFDLGKRRPALLRDLPALPSDNFDPHYVGGDLSMQACANDPQVAYHAVRNLARMARDTVTTRWTVMGFGRASAGAGQSTPRNLMGFKDGTRNIKSASDMGDHVWVKDGSWLHGGSYQVVRKISMDIEIWDADRVQDQHQVFGRTKGEGAPLTGKHEFDTPDFSASSGGAPVIPANSHVALAAPENNHGTKLLRRSYNYTDGINSSGQLDAGLLFVAYMNSPQAFIDIQSKLGASDRLNEYITHVGSGIFAVPPAPATGHYIGQDLFT